MSLTLPTAFENARRHRSSSACFILKMAVDTPKLGPSASVYLSTRHIPNLTISGPTTAEVENVVVRFSPINHGVDFYTHAYKMSSCIVTVSSNPISVNPDDGTMYNMSDLIGDGLGYGAVATVYLFPGGGATSIADCVEMLVGKITSAQMTDSGIDVKIDELDRWRHRSLPQNRATKADYPNIPASNDGATIGLCLGEYTDNLFWGINASPEADAKQGACQGLLVSAGDYYEYILTAGEMIQVNAPYIYLDAVKAWSHMHDYNNKATIYLDSNGYHSIKWKPQETTWHCGLYPTASYGSSTATVSGQRASDLNDDTNVQVYASSSSYADVIFVFHQNGSPDNDSVYNSFASMLIEGPILGISRDTIAAGVTSVGIDIWTGAAFQQLTAASFTDDQRTEYDIRTIYDWFGINGIFWHLGSGTALGTGAPFAVRVRWENTGASWTPDTTLVGEVNELYLSIHHSWPRPIPTSKIRIDGNSQRRASRRNHLDPGLNGNTRRRTEPQELKPNSGSLVSGGPKDNIDGVVVSVQGIIYPSPGWGDNHSDPGSSIEDAPGIIEYILRDELGITAIDETSFETVNVHHYGFSIGFMNIPHGTSIYSKDIIEDLCWENGIFVFRSRSGDIKMFDYELLLDDLGTIFPHDLIGGLPKLSTTDSNDFINDISIEYDPVEWFDGFAQRIENAKDTASINKIGTKHKDLTLTYQRGYRESGAFHDEVLGDPDGRGPIDRLLDRLIGAGINDSKTSPEYLLSRPHALVTLETIGHKFAHAEPGDYFALDSGEFDPVLKCWGESWSGKTFMVYETEVHENKVVIKGLNWQPMPLS